MRLQREEVRLLLEMLGIIGYSFVLYVALRVLGEPYSIFAYARF